MIRERLGKELLYFDGGMGTLLQERGLEPGELPETWNLTHADEIREIHRSYIEAGSDIILTNTFGANALKFHDDRYSLEEIVTSAVGHVRAAAEAAGAKRPIYTALDIGPTGKLLKPMGDLDFEAAYEAFKEVMICGEKAGADCIYQIFSGKLSLICLRKIKTCTYLVKEMLFYVLIYLLKIKLFIFSEIQKDIFFIVFDLNIYSV